MHILKVRIGDDCWGVSVGVVGSCWKSEDRCVLILRQGILSQCRVDKENGNME